MSFTTAAVDAALLVAAQTLPGHFEAGEALTIEALSAIQATTLSLPGGAIAVEAVVTGSADIGTVVLVVPGLVNHKSGEIFSRDDVRSAWTAALADVLTSLGSQVDGLSPGQLHLTDAFDALDQADEARVVGIFNDTTLAALLLTMPATATGQGAAAQLATAVAAATTQATQPTYAAQVADTNPGEPGTIATAQAAAATQAAAAATTDRQGAAPTVAPVSLQPLFGQMPFPIDPRRIDLLRDVLMGVSVELGRTRLTVQEILGLTPGSIVELDRAAGAPVDVLVNGKLIAHGEVVVVDEEFAVRISAVVSPDREGRVSA